MEVTNTLSPVPPPETEPTVAEVLTLYRDRISILKKGSGQEKYRIEQILRHSIASMKVKDVKSSHIAQFRDERLTQINPRTKKPLASSTVRLDLALLSDMFRIAMIEWGYCEENPVLKVRKQKLPPGRDRRLAPREEKMIRRYCMQKGMAEMNVIITLALETAMRQSEILNMRWEHVNLRSRIVRLLETKNGTTRDVPLSLAARDALISMGAKSSGQVFSYSSSAGFKSTWRGMIQRLKIQNLKFHDLRHEATSRLFELGSLDMMEIASITGHKTLSMLKRYTHLRSIRLVRKLEAGTSKTRAAVLSWLIPYPVHVKEHEEETKVFLPDFGNLEVKGTCRQTAIEQARNVLLRLLMTHFRAGTKAPAPDQYLAEEADDDSIVWLDPLGSSDSEFANLLAA